MDKIIMLIMFIGLTIGLIATYLGVGTVIVYAISYLLNYGFGLTQITWGQSFIITLAIYLAKAVLGYNNSGKE